MSTISTKNLFVWVVILRTFTIIMHIEIHTHIGAGKETCLCPHSPPLPCEYHHACSVLGQVAHMDLHDTNEPSSHFGIDESIFHETSLSCNQVCSH